MEKTMKLNFKEDMTKVLKGCLIALCISLVGILLFAVVLRFLSVSDIAIKIVNQVIKILSVLFGVLFCLKKDKSKRLLKGALVGALYTISSYFVFSLLVASFSFSVGIIFDLLFSTIVGGICGLFLGATK